MHVAEARNSQLAPPDGGPGTRFARGVVLVGSAGFAALTALVQTEQGEALDRAIAARLQANSDPRIERAMESVSWFGFPPQSRVLPLAYAAVQWVARLRIEAAFQLAAAGTGLLSMIVKSLMQRPRPVAGQGLRVVAAPLHGSSLPSGHVLTYVGVYGWLAITAHRQIKACVPRRLAVGALTSLIAAVGPSRIYLGHHWPSDVLSSYLLGSSYLAGLLVAYRRIPCGFLRIWRPR